MDEELREKVAMRIHAADIGLEFIHPTLREIVYELDDLKCADEIIAMVREQCDLDYARDKEEE